MEVGAVAYELGRLATAIQHTRFVKDARTSRARREVLSEANPRPKGSKSATTKRIAAEMKQSIAKGANISEAANRAFKNGLGVSQSANRQLFNRHEGKRRKLDR